MDSKIEFLVKLRDAAQMIAESTDDYIESLAPKEIKREQAVPEDVFNCLTYESQQGAKLGVFETASQDKNDKAKFGEALDTLDQAKATIKDRYHRQNYTCSYWIYNSKIYRQRRTQK
ncbi:MAG: hypothetical protein IAX22_04790 [Candidatus Bathyarchaeota archaeon]|nr:hypothetical protein [Candidatus Bathyarchaeota archaeon]